MILGGLCLLSCEKNFLDKKPDKSLLVPLTLADFQALLDNTAIMNYTPTLHVIAGDELTSTDAGWNAWSSAGQRNSYIWAEDVYEGSSAGDWSIPYQQVFYANIVLDGLTKEGLVQSDGYKQVKGSALFYRAMAIWNLAQMFAQPFDKSTAAQVPGIPYPLGPEVSGRPGRTTLQLTYEQILSDLFEAGNLLPLQASFKSRPAKPAVLAMLARVYLSMEDYVQAGVYADSCLKLNNKLIDFNTLNTTSTNPFPASLPNGNDEVLFHSVMLSYTFLSNALTSVEAGLYKSYADNDLRKALYFLVQGPVIRRKNGYGSPAGNFSGLATAEVYLMRAECLARENKVQDAMDDLNALLAMRWKRGTFKPLTATNGDDALKKVLEERRKELLARGLRWFDLRRLNKDSRFTLTIKHTIKGQEYILVPGDKRYTYPIPDNELLLSGIEQNPR